MKEYVKENTTLHPINPAIKIYNSYTWVSGVSPAGEIYIIKNDGLYYEDIKIVSQSSGGGYSITGEISYYAGATAPDGWLICDGSTYNVADYPALAVALGYDPTDTTFNVPDFRQCVLKGANTADGSGVITKASMPAHIHNVSVQHQHTVSLSNHTHPIPPSTTTTGGWSGSSTTRHLSSVNTASMTQTGENSQTVDSTLADMTISLNPGITLNNPGDITSNSDDIIRSYQYGVNVIIRT